MRAVTRKLAGILWLLAGAATLAAEPSTGLWDQYLWETPRTTRVAAAAEPWVVELRAEVQQVLDAGPLAPVRAVYADLEQDPYFLYWQGGRIITTLAMAWPHLTAEQQQAVVRYTRRELGAENRAPWAAKGFIPPDQGARREYHSFHEARGWDRYWGMWGRWKPTMGSFYGLWLYADRSRDWDTLQEHYAQITGLYGRKSREGELFGTMGAHVAMARIARHFGDPATLGLARTNAAAAFERGTDFAAVEASSQKYWKERYEPRQRGLVYQGWLFLDLCPEVGRYLAGKVSLPVLRRHEEGLKKYPLFWLRETPYWSRWTGDEGLGIPTELMGMIAPVERWVAGGAQARFSLWTRSAPICRGDCYWIEMLVHAIEVTGQTEWVEVDP